MYRDFNDIISQINTDDPKILAVAVAEDVSVLKAVQMAEEKGFVKALLFGDKKKILQLMKQLEIDSADYEIYDCFDNWDACHKAIDTVSQGKADFLMKGLVRMGTLLGLVLNKKYNLRTGKRMNILNVWDLKNINRLLVSTDAGLNIHLDLQKKKQMLENAVEFMHSINVKNPKVAVLTAIELVNEEMPATVDAALLASMWNRGQIKGCIVDGPLALDNAVNENAAQKKGIVSPVAGKADILIMPNIESGNIFYKCITSLFDYKVGNLCVGAKIPIVVSSRSDDYLTKFYSIVLGKFSLE
jgi:phosphate butyryltransferase